MDYTNIFNTLELELSLREFQRKQMIERLDEERQRAEEAEIECNRLSDLLRKSGIKDFAKTDGYKPEIGENYNYFDSDGSVGTTYNAGTYLDRLHVCCGNCASRWKI